MLLRRKVKPLDSEFPDLARELSKTISNAGGLGALRRFHDLEQIPVDADTGMELLVVDKEINLDITPIPRSKNNGCRKSVYP